MSDVDFRVAIMASGDRKSGGGGSTMNRVIRDVLEGKADFTVGMVICNNPPGTVGVHGLVEGINEDFSLKGYCRIDVVTIGPHNFSEGPQPRGQTLAESAAVCKELERRDIGFVSMLGWMRILNGEFIEEWGWHPEYGITDPTHSGRYNPKARIMNNHPGILPFTADTHGPGTHDKAVQLYKAGIIKRTAMTWHLAAPGIDTGLVIDEQPVDIYDTDSADALGARVQADAEKPLTVSVLDKHIKIRAEHLRVAA